MPNIKSSEMRPTPKQAQQTWAFFMAPSGIVAMRVRVTSAAVQIGSITTTVQLYADVYVHGQHPLELAPAQHS